MFINICIGCTQVIGGKCHIIHMVYTKSQYIFNSIVLDPRTNKLLQKYELIKFTCSFNIEEKQFTELQPFLTTPTSKHDFFTFDECLQKIKEYIPLQEIKKISTYECLGIHEPDMLNLTIKRMNKCLKIMSDCYDRNNIATELRFKMITDINLLTKITIVYNKEVKNAIRIIAQNDMIDHANETILTNFVSSAPIIEIHGNIKNCFQIAPVIINNMVYMIVGNDFYHASSKIFVTSEDIMRMFNRHFIFMNISKEDTKQIQYSDGKTSSYKKIPASRKTRSKNKTIPISKRQTDPNQTDIPNPELNSVNNQNEKIPATETSIVISQSNPTIKT